MRQKLIDIARAEIGVKEYPDNSNSVKYNDDIYGRHVEGPNYPWCGAFVSWVYHQAGLTIKGAGLSKGFVGCPYAVANVKKWGKIVTVPLPGDIGFADWNGDGKFDHTGIFEKDLGKGFFQCLEGNTSFKNDSNGGMVMCRADRKYKNWIFVRPNVLTDAGF